MAHQALTFKVTRQAPELITPAEPTPRELKLLSDLDDQRGLRVLMPGISFYRNSHLGDGKDPAKVIREALAQALVYYYPYAGRLREVRSDGKLAIDCNEEGILFIEADADVSVDDFGDVLQPPFPGLDELLFNVPGSDGLFDCPLLFIQVTRLKCGGFTFASRLNHTLSDATGLILFLNAVSEMARGLPAPSVLPVWERELLSARDPPRITCVHPEFDGQPGLMTPFENITHKSFYFGPTEVDTLRKLIPQHFLPCTTFELLTAILWRTRTISLQLDPSEEVRFSCIVNVRDRFNPPLPKGYYGNAVACPVAVTTAGELSSSPIEFGLELIRKAKNKVTEEYMRSVVDLMVLKNRPFFTMIHTYVVSNVARAGFESIDFGWGTAAYGGPAMRDVGPVPGMGTFFIPYKNKKGETGITVPVCLPANAMDLFVEELNQLFAAGRLAEESA